MVDTPDPTPITPGKLKTVLRWPWQIAGGLFLCLVFLLILQAAMHKQLNHDEHMYVSSGALLLRSEWLYADYPYFQTPLLTLLYSMAFSVWGDLLLVARLINVLCAFGACLLLFFGVARLLKVNGPAVQVALAAGSVTLYISGPQFIYTSGLAWNHDLPMLFTLAALFVVSRRKPDALSMFSILLSGVFIGFAASARLLFLVAALPFALFFLLTSTAGIMLRLRRLLVYGSGLLLGLLPCLPFLIASPNAFIFGNITYHNLNEQYWRAVGYERAMDLPGKLGYSLDVLVAEPANWLLIMGVVPVLLMAIRARNSLALLPIMLCLSTALALFVGALVPTPTWLQYFYAPSALLVVTLAVGISALVRAGSWRQAVPLFSLIALASAAFSIPHYQSLGNLLAFDDWASNSVSSVSREIRAALPEGKVVTLSPMYPLQAGLNIDSALATGPFGLRVANTLPISTRLTSGLYSAEDVVEVMHLDPPEGILTGAEGLLEAPLVQFAVEGGYVEKRLSNGLTLWLRRDQ